MKPLMLSLLLLCSVATAQDLTQISESRDGNASWFLKSDRVTKAGTNYSAWVYMFLKRPSKITANAAATFTHSTANWIADCNEGKVAYGETFLYDANDDQVATMRGAEYSFSRPVPDSHADAFLRLVCRMVGKPLQ